MFRRKYFKYVSILEQILFETMLIIAREIRDADEKRDKNLLSPVFSLRDLERIRDESRTNVVVGTSETAV